MLQVSEKSGLRIGEQLLAYDKPMASLSTCHLCILPWMEILLNLVKYVIFSKINGVLATPESKHEFV